MMKNNCLRSLIEIATPIDPTTHSRKTFLEIIEQNPQLEDNFRRQCTIEFMLSIKEKGIYIIVDRVKNKQLFGDLTPSIRLGYCGQEELPTITLDY